MNGFGLILPFLRPIEAFILDPSVSEVMVNGADRVFIERSRDLSPVTVTGLAEKFLLVAVKNIARRLGDDISEASPILDTRLPDGSRVAAVLPPCSVNGITLTIRKLTSRNFTMNDLVRSDTLPEALALELEEHVHHSKNILIGAGTGKTTLLNILAGFIPHDERLVIIEDTAEIQVEGQPRPARGPARAERLACC